MSSRRTFIQQAGLLTAGLFISRAVACSRGAEKVKDIGIQLYTLRDQIGKDVKGVLAKVAAAGYTQVETYGYSATDKFWGLEPEAFKALLDENGLMSPSGHYGFDAYIGGKEDDLQLYIEAANVLGQRYITAPYLDVSLRKTADDYKKVAESLNKAAETCNKSGLSLAYHNHDFEFHPIDGTTGYEVLLNETDPSLVKFEADLYWMVRAGKKPVELFAQHPGRFVMWHVKDMDKTNHSINTEVGNGSINFKQIFEASKTSGLEYIFVEQENFSIDPYQSITASAKYVKSNLLTF